MPHLLISVDDHVQEPRDLWLERLSRRWGDRVPHVERGDRGAEHWVVDREPVGLLEAGSAGALMPDRAQEPGRWQDVPAPAYVPDARIRAMDADGVYASVLYPTVAGRSGETLARIGDPELQGECVRAYNDWLVDDWATASRRFIPQCLAPISSIEAAATEIRRSLGRGHRGVVLPPVPSDFHDLPMINEPVWDPLWDICQEAGVPVCFHAGTSERIQLRPHEGYSPLLADALRAVTGPVSTAFILVNFLLSRVLDRFPRLRVVFAESGVAWAAYLLEYADHQFTHDRLFDEGYALKPSELFRRNCFLTASYEHVSLRTRDAIGVENILWATHFPLPSSSWPSTRQVIARVAPLMSREERRQILWENAARLYGITDLPQDGVSSAGNEP